MLTANVRRIYVVIFVCWFAALAAVKAGPLQDSSEAALHFKIAVAALNDGNFAVALKELEKSAALQPQNALIHYNLAIVNQKFDRPRMALISLRHAMQLGLRSAESQVASALLVTLNYEIEKFHQAFVGIWDGQDQSGSQVYVFKANGTYSYVSLLGRRGWMSS